ncbi:hypothetical protein NQ318_001516 [Aromia moschata]|uniref:Uncharacterized protein n=1 Tax=Aromia moschata TaxID=1265417 RepID=A0AAV8Y8Q1_9CUCU|nr:hypothetical protein NQ318_001516 [Aromia moschata]
MPPTWRLCCIGVSLATAGDLNGEDNLEVGPLRDLCGKEWLLLLFAMEHWERLKIISVTHLLYSSEETQKTQNITKSRACAVGLASMHPHLYTSVLVVAYQTLTEKARQLKIATPGRDLNNAHRGIATGKTAL